MIDLLVSICTNVAVKPFDCIARRVPSTVVTQDSRPYFLHVILVNNVDWSWARDSFSCKQASRCL